MTLEHDLRDGTDRDGLLVGVDIGGSKLAVLVADQHLVLRGRHLTRTQVGDPDLAVNQIADAVDAALHDAGATREDLSAVGIGVPGRVERFTGTVSLAVNLGWEHLPLGARLTDRLGRSVLVENDVRAAAAGLHERRVLGDLDDLAYLSIGTGISAGVVLGGTLHRGIRGMAGEIGHVVLDPTGPACPCGLRGCFEALASGRAVGRQAEAELDAGTPSSLRDHRPVSAVDVYREAASGDDLALRIADTAGRWVARAVHELVMTYDVRRVVVGGGVTGAGHTFLAPVVRALDELRAASELAREALPPDVVYLLPPDADAGGWGAVILARSASTVTPKQPAHPLILGTEVASE
jgi:predicted NBD/HSP70 family sugar kinase